MLENNYRTGVFSAVWPSIMAVTRRIQREIRSIIMSNTEKLVLRIRVKLSELDELEKLYEVNIQVYRLSPIRSHGEVKGDETNESDIAATLLRRSHRHYSSKLYLNLNENHFSYIKNLARYSKSFCCSRFGKYWKGVNYLRRHEQTCDGKVQLKYPGSAYHVPKTIFEELEDEGIILPEEARYFPYRARFDFECFFDKEKCSPQCECL